MFACSWISSAVATVVCIAQYWNFITLGTSIITNILVVFLKICSWRCLITNKLPQSLGSLLNQGSTVLNPALYRTVKITISYLQWLHTWGLEWMNFLIHGMLNGRLSAEFLAVVVHGLTLHLLLEQKCCVASAPEGSWAQWPERENNNKK